MFRVKKIVEYFKSAGKKKFTDNLVIVVIIGIVLVIAGGSIFGKKDSEDYLPSDENEAQAIKTGSKSDSSDILEKKIKNILSRIEGAGRVDVLVTYESGAEVIPATDIKKSENLTEEKDSQGGTRSAKQNEYESKTVYEGGTSGNGSPFILKEIYPEVKGVVVVADGADRAVVRGNLTRAVRVLLDISIHKIKVFPSNYRR